MGDLSLDVHPLVEINQEENSIAFSPSNEDKETLALTGTMRALTKNLIQGVTEGFEKIRDKWELAIETKPKGEIGVEFRVFASSFL